MSGGGLSSVISNNVSSAPCPAALKSLQNILSPPPILPSNNDSSANNTTYIRELSSFNAVNTALSGHLRREIIDSMLNIVKFRKYSTFALETSVDILSRLISYNVGSLRSNETISLITNEALNNYVETGRRKTKLAIDMRDSSYVNSMFQTDHRSLNTSDTVINTLKTVRKILLHSSSRGAKVRGGKEQSKARVKEGWAEGSLQGCPVL